MHIDAFQTLADPTRRRVIDALSGGERQVNDIVEQVGIHQSGVSRHLRILHEAGFVTVRRTGRRRLYALKPEPFREVDDWLERYRGLWEARLDRFGAALDARQAKAKPTEERRAMSGTVQASVVVERTYRATQEELWALWTTKDGFESWWGPQQFRVEVHTLEPREGGRLHYDMVAATPAAIKAMQDLGAPIRQPCGGQYSAFRPHDHLALTQVIDFLPGVPPYDSIMSVDFYPVGEDRVRMVVTLSPMHDAATTDMQKQGFISQLTKLDARFSA